jgi:aspartokinase
VTLLFPPICFPYQFSHALYISTGWIYEFSYCFYQIHRQEILSYLHQKTRKERAPEMEMTKVLSVNTNTQILNIRFLDLSLNEGLQSLMNSFENSKLATPQIIYQRGDTSKSCEFFITLPEETFDAVVEAVKNYSKKAELKVETSTQWATISITGRGFVNSNMAFEMSKKLAEKKIYPEGLIVSPLTLSVVVQKNKAVEGAALLHREFVENAPTER